VIQAPKIRQNSFSGASNLDLAPISALIFQVMLRREASAFFKSAVKSRFGVESTFQSKGKKGFLTMFSLLKFFENGFGAVLIDEVVEVELEALIHDLGHLFGVGFEFFRHIG
jgi:hypothetical protein